MYLNNSHDKATRVTIFIPGHHNITDEQHERLVKYATELIAGSTGEITHVDRRAAERTEKWIIEPMTRPEVDLRLAISWSLERMFRHFTVITSKK